MSSRNIVGLGDPCREKLHVLADTSLEQSLIEWRGRVLL